MKKKGHKKINIQMFCKEEVHIMTEINKVTETTKC